MCCTTYNGKPLVVTTHCTNSAIRCYKRDSGELVWKVEGKLPGMGKKMRPWDITADGWGHLFVADIDNKCIQKFSVTGEYLGVILEEGEQGLGDPRHVRWNESNSALVVGHEKDNNYLVSVVYV